MRKRTIFGIVMLLVVLSMSSMSVVKAAIYVWDGVHFVEGYEGEWIKYPHPDRVYYGISPYTTQGVDGNMLHHCQVDSAKSITLVAAADVLCAALGIYIGGKMGGLYGAVAGFIIGGALGVFITYVSEAYFLDEYNCIWWWLSLAFMDWAVANAYTLWYYGLTNPAYATGLVLSMLYASGYIRVGALTFLDAIGAGNPSPPPSGGGCPTLFVWNGAEYVCEGLLDIHNPDGIDEITSHVLIHTPEPVEHRYLMRLTEHPKTYSYIDQVQLFATLKDGTEIKLPLVSAVHSEDGDVLQELRLSDDVRADLVGADHNNGISEWIDLQFVAPNGLEIEQFTFVIEGHNIPEFEK